MTLKVPNPRPKIDDRLPRKLLPAMLSIGLASLAISGCTANETKTPRDKKVILTTFTVLADIVQNVAGDKAIVTSIVKPGAEIHSYEPTPSDLERAKGADLILDNGLLLERWADRFFTNLPKVPRKTLSAGIKTIDITEDAYQGKPNPHAWMSPQNALIYIENTRKALAELDPKNATTYQQNAAIYSAKLRTLDQRLKTAIAQLPESKRHLVTCEGAFPYLARDYGLKESYLWAVNSEQQATPKQIIRTIETVKSNKIPAVFCESTVNDKAQRQVAKESGATFSGLFYVDSLSPPDGPAPTYLKLLDHNITTYLQALTPKT
jgi:manganese transport system substrate-binding protein